MSYPSGGILYSITPKFVIPAKAGIQ